MITAESVHSASIKKALFGYQVDEVDHLLETIEDQLREDSALIAELQEKHESMKGVNLEKEQQIQSLQEQLDAMTAERDALKDAAVEAEAAKAAKADDPLPIGNLDEISNFMLTVHRTSEQIISEAQAQADELMASTQAETAKMIADATERRDSIDAEYTKLRSELIDLRKNSVKSLTGTLERIQTLPDFEAIPGTEQPSASFADKFAALKKKFQDFWGV